MLRGQGFSMRLFPYFTILLLGFGVIHPSMCLSSIDPVVLSNVRKAMGKAIESRVHISKAYEACELWDGIDFQMLPKKVRATAFALQAACLVRVGKDTDALPVYDNCLKLREELEEKTFEDVKIGKASTLQRCMFYDEAINQYLECSSKSMLFETKEFDKAIQILENQSDQDDYEIMGMRGLLHLMKDDENVENIDMIHLIDASKISPLFQWICCILDQNTTADPFTYSILEIATINLSPFDDPFLLDLDDKILLHNLLQNADDSFWPVGFILPQEGGKFKKYMDCCKNKTSWVLKAKSGYGSHGNQLVTAEEVITLLENDPIPESILCQSLVNPPLILDNRKFSIRVYVYYFVDNDVYLSNLGLVKLAAETYEEDNLNNNRIHMTNSGREESMPQHDFVFLRDKFHEAGWSYDEFWRRVQSAVSITMQCYHKKVQGQNQSYRPQLARFSIPKILGFDFTMTKDLQPMLLEVNRFPGMEPRGEDDSEVKETVVRDAW
eukprot:CAMPEP_0194196116 /NCGR_PEP_ID=MMETSP0154-20130528/76497_1 /TAXON_ID=1049557 /ORGANISM="Thalassiothrix antarctica, Strain L6-D1" /LENGTH=496 /DNA_ID=CAMNT_0038920693 /DNA_START=68 /DNA_END=1556 /DNA_ORIENTATION=-